MYSEIVREPQFFFDNKGEFLPEATTFIINGERLQYLVQFLNSPITAYLFKTFYAGGGLGESGYRYKKLFLQNLPIPIYENKLERLDDKTIFSLYKLNAEERKFIESQQNQ